MKFFKKITDFLKEVRQELAKVSWSTRQELTGSTVVVIVITSFMALFIGLVDLFLSKMVSLLYK